jgi:hypothetical protein
MVEQDYLLCRAVAAIFEDGFLSKQVAMRGGTVLHKGHLAPAIFGNSGRVFLDGRSPGGTQFGHEVEDTSKHIHLRSLQPRGHARAPQDRGQSERESEPLSDRAGPDPRAQRKRRTARCSGPIV